ncbi:hypothetical protein RchiOBHm_Chr7g0198121 [Rosa chinensis]|uniref:Uncharacterized protein n=1 Tax=Rosa chinensis TaxID=74649 RepID=A0A2P6P714_ROSCH|nr:hypothetical protein RchiOBHm_Chr7g0198121 [Rosa chinensis]
MKVSVDILKIISELESHKKDFSRLNYDFSKLKVCIRKFCELSLLLLVPFHISSFLYSNLCSQPQTERRHSYLFNKTCDTIFGVHLGYLCHCEISFSHHCLAAIPSHSH